MLEFYILDLHETATCVRVWIMLSMELLKRTSNVKGEKNRFHSCTHICRQRICAPIWKNNLSHSRNWKMKRVTTFYVMPNRLLKTNWGQHCGCCMALTQLISHTVRTKMVWYELLRERHTHTQEYVKLLPYIPWAWDIVVRQRTNQPIFSILFLFVVVIFFLLPFSFSSCFGGEMEKIDMHAHGTACVYVWLDFTSVWKSIV